MTIEAKLSNGIALRLNKQDNCCGGKLGEYGKIINDLRTEIERLRKIRSRSFGIVKSTLIAIKS